MILQYRETISNRPVQFNAPRAEDVKWQWGLFLPENLVCIASDGTGRQLDGRFGWKNSQMILLHRETIFNKSLRFNAPRA